MVIINEIYDGLQVTVEDLFRSKESPIERNSLERNSNHSRSRMDDRDKDRRWNNKVSSTTHNGNNVLRVSPDSQSQDRDSPLSPPPDSRPAPPIAPKSVSEFPEYLT